MAEKSTNVDPQKLSELQTAMANLKNKIGDLTSSLDNILSKANEKWRDDQFLDFKETYKKYRDGIKTFETNLDNVAKKTLPPLITDAINTSKVNTKG